VKPGEASVDAALARLDLSLVHSPGAGGESLADAGFVIVHRDGARRVDDRCGIWTVGQRLIGCIDRVHLYLTTVADPDGHPVAESEWLRGWDAKAALGWSPERVSERRRGEVFRVVCGDRLLGCIHSGRKDFVIEAVGAATPWAMQHGPGSCMISAGEQVVAAGWSRACSFWEDLRGNTWLTTAIVFDADLSSDHRLVALFAIIGRLGPPSSPPD
jgi:hypothetical protein